MALDLQTHGDATNLGAALTSPATFRVDTRRHGSSVVLALQGEADLATASALTTALAQVSEETTGHVVLDAARLDFVDAHCLGVIANARADLGAQGRHVVVRSPTTFLRRMLRVLDMEDLVESEEAESRPRG